MSVKVSSSGPRGQKTYEIRWKNGELYDYTDNAAAAKRLAAAARKAERAYYGGGRRKNPTKAQKRAKAKTSATKRRVASALAKYLKLTNPGAKLAGAKVQKLAGGVTKITVVKLPRGRR